MLNLKLYLNFNTKLNFFANFLHFFYFNLKNKEGEVPHSFSKGVGNVFCVASEIVIYLSK